MIWLLATPGRDTLTVMFWNVENFFDWRNDSTTVSDGEFSPAGERHWTWKRFQAKANAFAKALFWVEGETGRLPDIVGLEEVENAFVLRQVLQKTALRKTDYKYVHYDSPDRRGIDVALLYRSSRLELLESKPCHLYAADTVMASRDILLCVFRKMADQVGHDDSYARFAVLVNHHPSKYGGVAESEPQRRIAVERLRDLADSLEAVGIDRIIAGGDFNDTPANPVFRLLAPVLVPLHMDLSDVDREPSNTTASGNSLIISMYRHLGTACHPYLQPATNPPCASSAFHFSSPEIRSIQGRNPSALIPVPVIPAAFPTICRSCWRSYVPLDAE